MLSSYLGNLAIAGACRAACAAAAFNGARASPLLRSFVTGRPAQKSLGFSVAPPSHPLRSKPLILTCSLFMPRTPAGPLQPLGGYQQARSVTKFSYRTGGRRTSRPVVRRFMRLNCGLWIRPRSGRAKKLWKKPEHILQDLRTHVFCNRTQSKMLDKMVGDYWKKPKYYVDDPYEPYHERSNFLHAKKTWW